MADRGQGALPGMGGRGDGARPRRMRRAIDTHVRTLTALGHLEPVDGALVAMARTLGDAWDAEITDPAGSRYTESTIAGRLLPVLLELRGERRDAASDIGYDAELESLKAALRDAAGSRPPDARP